MAIASKAKLLVAAFIVLYSAKSLHFSNAEEIDETGVKRLPLNADSLAKSIEVPQDVLQNTLYYLIGDTEYTPEDRGIPIYHIDDLREPKYIEISLKPQGYLLASLTKDDFPVIRFNGDEDATRPSAELGEAHKYVIYDESLDVIALDVTGKVIKSLSSSFGENDMANKQVRTENKDFMREKHREEAKSRWSHDYVMECDRGHTIALCSNKLKEGISHIRFPDDFGAAREMRTSGAVWNNEFKKFVELEKHGDTWVKGTTESSWEKSHISLVIEKRVGYCGLAKINVPCDDRIYNKPLWLGNTRITIVNEILNDVEDEKDLPLSVHQDMRSWSSWSSWSTYSADNYMNVPNYYQHNCCGCISGCGAVAWAMLFAWADLQTGFSKTIYGTATENPPSTMTSEVMQYIEQIRNEVGTVCLLGNGATYPWRMDDVKGWFQARGGGNLEASYNSLGIRTDGLRDCARSEIVSLKRPVVLGVDWLKHYPVATQYRERSRTRRTLFGGTRTEYDHEAYLNQGWGGSGNAWATLSTWFCGTIDP